MASTIFLPKADPPQAKTTLTSDSVYYENSLDLRIAESGAD